MIIVPKVRSQNYQRFNQIQTRQNRLSSEVWETNSSKKQQSKNNVAVNGAEKCILFSSLFFFCESFSFLSCFFLFFFFFFLIRRGGRGGTSSRCNGEIVFQSPLICLLRIPQKCRGMATLRRVVDRSWQTGDWTLPLLTHWIGGSDWMRGLVEYLQYYGKGGSNVARRGL